MENIIKDDLRNSLTAKLREVKNIIVKNVSATIVEINMITPILSDIDPKDLFSGEKIIIFFNGELRVSIQNEFGDNTESTCRFSRHSIELHYDAKMRKFFIDELGQIYFD